MQNQTRKVIGVDNGLRKGLKLPQRRELKLPGKTPMVTKAEQLPDDDWYYAKGDGSLGPFKATVMEALIKSGEISSTTYVWKDGLDDWTQLGSTELSSLVHKAGRPVHSKIPRTQISISNTSESQPTAGGESKKEVIQAISSLFVLAALAIGGWKGYELIGEWYNGIMEENSIAKGKADENVFRTKRAQTPEKFCGIVFGEDIDHRFPNAKFVDNSKSRRSEFSYRIADVTLGTPFRNFRTGKVYASMTSKKIYKVILTHHFPRKSTTAVDDAEYKATLNALKVKYGVGNVEEEGWGGDKTHKFKVGNVLITLMFTTEGLIDSGKLELEAENMEYKNLAVAECNKFYEERARTDVENMKSFENGGVDAL